MFLPQHIERTRRPPSQQFSRIFLQRLRTEVAKFKASRPVRDSVETAQNVREGRKTPRWIHGRHAHRRTESEVVVGGQKCGDARCVGRLGSLSSKLQKKKNSSKNTFIQKHFHPKTLSSQNTFIQNRRQFHPRHFHPKTVSSNDTFIPKWFRPTTLSSKTGFIQ